MDGIRWIGGYRQEDGRLHQCEGDMSCVVFVECCIRHNSHTRYTTQRLNVEGTHAVYTAEINGEICVLKQFSVSTLTDIKKFRKVCWCWWCVCIET